MKSKRRFDGKVFDPKPTVSFQEYLEEIQKWSVAYEEEIERRDMEIYNLKSQREALAERFEALQNEYNLHKEAIDKWLAYKEQKRKEEEERLRLERAAIKIQVTMKVARMLVLH